MADAPDYDKGEPRPIPTDGPSMHDLVCGDIDSHFHFKLASPEIRDIAKHLIGARKIYGLNKYGTILQANNGRNPGNDMLEEMLDLLVYARQQICEEPDDSNLLLEMKGNYTSLLKSFMFLILIEKRRDEDS